MLLFGRGCGPRDYGDRPKRLRSPALGMPLKPALSQGIRRSRFSRYELAERSSEVTGSDGTSLKSVLVLPLIVAGPGNVQDGAFALMLLMLNRFPLLALGSQNVGLPTFRFSQGRHLDTHLENSVLGSAHNPS